MKNILIAIILFVFGTSATAMNVGSAESKKIMQEGEVLASQIYNGDKKISDSFAVMIIRHNGELHQCIVSQSALFCFKWAHVD